MQRWPRYIGRPQLAAGGNFIEVAEITPVM